MIHTAHSAPPALTDISPQENARANGRGLGRFLDRFLCGRENHHLFHTCLGLGAMHIGLPGGAESQVEWSLPLAVINNRSFPAELMTPTLNPLEAMGMSHPPIYENTLSTALNLPDLPYNDAAHFLCMANGVYDSGKKFTELWNDPRMHHNVFNVLTDKSFIGTGLPHAASIAVMTLLHPLGALIAIPMGHACGQMVDGALRTLLGDPHMARKVESDPLLTDIMKEANVLRGMLAAENKAGQGVRLSLLERAPLRPGVPNEVAFRLLRENGEPLREPEMKVTHGKPLHAFIVDAGLSDCYHVHPRVFEADGTCRLSFTPKTDHPYRIFVDYQLSGQEPAMIYADIPARQKTRPNSIIQAKEADIRANAAERMALGVA